MNTLFLHLGMHKTATTSLQISVFPQIKDSIFIGRKPLESMHDQHHLYLQIADYCFKKEDQDPRAIKEELQNLLKTNNVILSDEWFTADFSMQTHFNGRPWQERLQQLYAIVEGLPFKILFTIRAPDKALHSLFCEYNEHDIDLPYSTAESFALESNDSKAFDFPNLQKLATEIFEQIPDFLCYEDLIEKPAAFNKKFQEWLETAESVDISHANQAIYNVQGKTIHKPAGRYAFFSYFIELIPDRLKRISPNQKAIIKKILYGRGKAETIDYFSPYTIEIIEKQYQKAYEFLLNSRL
ncbi:hypothetical protein N9H39_11330 [Gammaproteobacteria bacterium]|nr:hypothetical protein [Gammaproteobacteria bacterium]